MRACIGKSFTITGPEGLMTFETVGVVPRALRYLFEEVIARNSSESPVTVKASYLEIYNEHVRDKNNFYRIYSLTTHSIGL